MPLKNYSEKETSQSLGNNEKLRLFKSEKSSNFSHKEEEQEQELKQKTEDKYNAMPLDSAKRLIELADKPINKVERLDKLEKTTESLKRDIIALSKVVISFEKFYKKEVNLKDAKSISATEKYELLRNFAIFCDDKKKEIDKLWDKIKGSGTNVSDLIDESRNIRDEYKAFLQRSHEMAIAFASHLAIDMNEASDVTAEDEAIIENG